MSGLESAQARARRDMVEAALAADHEKSVRDAFAGAALSGMIASDQSCDRTRVDKQVWAHVAYGFADAMMEARKHTPQEITNFLRSKGL